MREIRFINQRLGDRAALEKTLLADVADSILRNSAFLMSGPGRANYSA